MKGSCASALNSALHIFEGVRVGKMCGASFTPRRLADNATRNGQAGRDENGKD